jgi:hypothetical protein
MLKRWIIRVRFYWWRIIDAFFDMYVVSTTLFRKAKWRKQLFFRYADGFLLSESIGHVL